MYDITYHLNTHGDLVISRGPNWDYEGEPRDFYDALESLTANDSYEWLGDYDYARLGWLTSCWYCLAYGVERDDRGNILDFDEAYYDDLYAIRDPLDALRRDGQVTLYRVTA